MIDSSTGLETGHRVVQHKDSENSLTPTNISTLTRHQVKDNNFQTASSADMEEKQDSTIQSSIYIPERRYSGYEETMFHKDQKLVDGRTYQGGFQVNEEANDQVHTKTDTTSQRTQETRHTMNFQEREQESLSDGGEKEGGVDVDGVDEDHKSKANDRNSKSHDIDPHDHYQEAEGMGSSDIKNSDSDFSRKENEVLEKNTALPGEIDEELTGKENIFAKGEEGLNVAHEEDEGNMEAVNQRHEAQESIENYKYQTNKSDIDLPGHVNREKSYSTDSGEIDDRDEGKKENTDVEERLINNEHGNEVDYEKKEDDKSISIHDNGVDDVASDTFEGFDKMNVEYDSGEKNSTPYSQDKEENKQTYAWKEKHSNVNLSDRITKVHDFKSDHVQSEDVNDRGYNGAKESVQDEEDKGIGDREKKGSENKYNDGKSDVVQGDGKDTNEDNHEESGDKIDSEETAYLEKAKGNDESVDRLGYYGEVKRGNNETVTAENNKGRFDVSSEIMDPNGGLQNETFEDEDSHKKGKDTLLYEFVADDNHIGFVDEAGEINDEEIGAVIEDRNIEGYGLAYDSIEEENETYSEDNEPEEGGGRSHIMEANKYKYEEPVDGENDYEHSYDVEITQDDKPRDEHLDSEKSERPGDQNKVADDSAELKDDFVSPKKHENYLLGNSDMDPKMLADFAQEIEQRNKDMPQEDYQRIGATVVEEDALFY